MAVTDLSSLRTNYKIVATSNNSSKTTVGATSEIATGETSISSNGCAKPESISNQFENSISGVAAKTQHSNESETGKDNVLKNSCSKKKLDAILDEDNTNSTHNELENPKYKMLSAIDDNSTEYIVDDKADASSNISSIDSSEILKKDKLADEPTTAQFTKLYISPNEKFFFNSDIKSSPLLASTPPVVSKALIGAYPYLLILEFILSILTWTNDDIYLNLTVMSSILTFVAYFDFIMIYFGHLVIFTCIVCYFLVIKEVVQKQQNSKPTLDNIVHVLTSVSVKFDIFLTPITSLNFSNFGDIKKILINIILLTPFYLLLSYFIIGNGKNIVLFSVFYFLSYHSIWARVTRRILWKSKTIRIISFYFTGSNGAKNFNNNQRLANVLSQVNINGLTSANSDASGKQPITFTYVICENQRKWLGIGWTANLLNYERAPFTDEFLNETQPPDEFVLPEYTQGQSLAGMPNSEDDLVWRWIDKTWRLDLTNDGSLTLKNHDKKTVANPNRDEGYIYYDNVWKKPSSEDSFGKYTRRRRWVRTAELIPRSRLNEISSSGNNENVLVDCDTITASGVGSNFPGDVKKRKSLRFSSTPEVIVEHDELT